MSEPKKKSQQPKRPWERPRLVASSVFGAEAMTGSCCRTTGSCGNDTTQRNPARIAIDASKGRNSTVS